MSNDLAMLQLFAHAILSRAEAYDWSLQGFGMFRLYLSKAVRLHVWSPQHAVPNVSTIHNHPWDFTSDVLCGAIVDQRYRLLRSDGEVPIVEQYIEQPIVCGPGGGPIGSARKVRLVCSRVRRYLPVATEGIRGGRYSLDAEDLHATLATPGTVTLVERFFREDRSRENALVYHPEGTSWVSAEPRAATKEEVREMALLALAQLKLEGVG